MSVAIGIDIGTSTSCVGVYRKGKVEIIANENGHRTTPCQVAFTDKEQLIGDTAKSQAGMNPDNTIFNAKRLIGKTFDDPCVQSDLKYFPFQVIDVSNKPKIKVQYKGEDKEFSPEEVLSILIAKIKTRAESFLGSSVTNAVLTVPAYFNEAQIQATKDAGKLAGLNILSVINEPTAAAIAYGLDKSSKAEQNILVFHLGGSATYVSVLNIKDGVLEIKSTTADINLGGNDFDTLIINHMIQDYKKKHDDKDISSNRRTMQRLRQACSKAKRTLSVSETISLQLDALFEGKNFYYSLSRESFEEICSSLFKRIHEHVEKALKDSKLEISQISDIIMEGGTCRMPKIKKMLSCHFDEKVLRNSIITDEVAAHGAAIKAASL